MISPLPHLQSALAGLARAAEANCALVSDLDWTRASEHISALLHRWTPADGKPLVARGIHVSRAAKYKLRRDTLGRVYTARPKKPLRPSRLKSKSKIIRLHLLKTEAA